MDIAFFVPRCTTDNSHGRYVMELALRLAKAHRVEVFSGGFAQSVRQRVVCHLLPVLDRPAILRSTTMWSTAIAASAVARRFQIIHVGGADAPVGNVVTAHYCNAAYAGYPGERQSLLRKLNAAVGERLERYCFRKVSTRRVIAVSKRLEGQVAQHYGVDASRLRVIHHGVDTQHFSARGRGVRDGVRQSLGFKDGDFVTLFVGGDYRLKGLPLLLNAIAQLNGASKLLVIGPERDQLLRTLLDRDDLRDRVVIVSRTKDIVPYYSAADCFVSPTWYDAFGLATLEAMACSLPVIVSRAAGVSEILQDGVDSIVLDRPDQGNVLAAQIARLADDPGLRATLGQRARMVAEQHSWDRVVAATEDVYREALAS
jgi:glycosyltransferase involved in cell wall biosynthesis